MLMVMTTYACETLKENAELTKENAMLKIQNRELLARCDCMEAEKAELKDAVRPVVEWWNVLKKRPGFCPVEGANFFVLGQHGDENRVDIKQLDALATLAGEV